MVSNMSNATVSNLADNVEDYSVDTKNPEGITGSEVRYSNTNFSKYFGYYRSIPELKSSIDALTTWVLGLGYTSDIRTKVILEGVKGFGKDTAKNIFMNQFRIKKLNGNAYCQIIRDEDTGILINLKPLNPARITTVCDADGIINRYEYSNGKQIIKNLKPNEVWHSVNQRVADEITGVSVIEACQWVIDARNEAMADWRRISHRSTVRIFYYPVGNLAKLEELKTNYQDAIKAGEILILPIAPNEGEMKDLVLPPIDGFLRWIQYLENFFYQVLGVPKVIATSENFTEAASKVGMVTFEPPAETEREDFENEIWQQLGLKIKFNSPPSLLDNFQRDEAKNTGQLGFQPNNVQIGAK